MSELSSISLHTKQGQERLEAQVKSTPTLLKLAGIRLPKKPKILCLMAGSCTEGLALAQHFNVEVTCPDLQRRLLSKGAQEAKKRKLRIRTIQGNVGSLDKSVGRGFHLITLMGSPIGHLSINEFDQVLVKVKKVLSRSGFLLIDQTDTIFRILPNYSDAFVANRDPPVVNVHAGFNPREGYFERLYLGEGKHGVYKMHMWGPWLIEYMLKKNGFRKVNVIPYVDPYAKFQTNLFVSSL